MSIDNIKNKLKQTSKKDTTWLKQAKWRRENEDWLDISFAIAVKMLSVLKINKKTETFPKSQKDLAEAMDCTPQYINKLLKGAEKLNIETISKIQKALRITIIDNDIKSYKTELIMQYEEEFVKPNSATIKNYKKLDGIIQYNFTTSRIPTQLDEFRSVSNG